MWCNVLHWNGNVNQTLPRVMFPSTQHHIYIYAYHYISLSIFCPPQWFSTRRRPVLRPPGTTAGHIRVYDSAPTLNTMESDHKQWTKRCDLQGGECWGGGLWMQHWNESNTSTRSLIWRGQRGILYMLSYKWCFVRRVLTKTTVPFWCKRGSDQNTAEPVGQHGWPLCFSGSLQ